MFSDSFSASNPAQRVAALLDPGSFREIAQQARGALTAGTGTVGGTALALPGANVQILPPAAMARVIGRHSARGDVENYLRAGVVDTVI
jgi:acetyl-CoA carboxylase beta subunit